MHGVTGSPLSGLPIIKVLLLNTILIYFKVAFNQVFLTSAGNLATSAKLLDSGMKCDTFEPDYTKVGNLFFN